MTNRPAADRGERSYQHTILHRVSIGVHQAVVVKGFHTVVEQQCLWQRIAAAGGNKKTSAVWIVVLGFDVLAFLGSCRILKAEERPSIARLINIGRLQPRSETKT